MKKFKKFLLACLCGLVLASAVGLTACGGDDTINVIGDDYSYTNPEKEKAETDAGFVIDGNIDEAQYSTVKRVTLKKRLGYETADVETVVYFGEKGLYFGFIDTENNRIYANEERSTIIGSAIEMYMMVGGTGVSENDLYHAFEIDLTAGGRLNFKRNACFTYNQGSWRQCHRPSGIMPYMGVTAQGGEINTPECTGYTLELFIPYAYLVNVGIMQEAVKPSYIFINPAHIKSNSERSGDGSRTWTSLTETQLSSYSYGLPNTWYRINEKGFVTNDINITYKGNGKGLVVEKNSFDNMPNGNSLTLNITEEAGSAIKSLKINGVECVKQIVSDGKKGIYTIGKVNGDVNIEAEFEKLSPVTYNVSGRIVNESAADWDDIKYDLVLCANRNIKDTDLYFDYETGEFNEALSEGNYKIILRGSNGEDIVVKEISLYEDIENLELVLTNENYGPTRVVSIATVDGGYGEVSVYDGLIDNDQFVMKFYFGSEFGAKGINSIAQYVEELQILSESGWQRFQLMRWNSTYCVKFQDNTGYDITGTAKQTYMDQQGLYLILVRDGSNLELYADNGNGALQMIAGVKTNISTNILSIKMYGRDGVSGSSRVLFADCEIKLGTTDKDFFNNRVTPIVSNDDDAVEITGLKDGDYALGEKINLTITPKDGYVIYALYYNGKSIPLSNDNTYSFTCGVGAMIQVDSIVTGPISINCDDMLNGTINFEKDIDEYQLGEDVNFYLEGDEDYKVKQVFLNGEDITARYTRIDKVDGLLRYYYSFEKCALRVMNLSATFDQAVSGIFFDDVYTTGNNVRTTYQFDLLDSDVMFIATLGFDKTMELNLSGRWLDAIRLSCVTGDSIEIQLLRWDDNVMFKMLPNGGQTGSQGFILPATVLQTLCHDNELKVLIHYKGATVDVYGCDLDGRAVKVVSDWSVASFDGYPLEKVMFFKAETNFEGKEGYMKDAVIYGMSGLYVRVRDNDPENGTVDYIKKDYKIGDYIEISIVPDNGYVIESLLLNGAPIAVDEDYKFVIPCIDRELLNFEVSFIETPKLDVSYKLDMEIDDGVEFTFRNRKSNVIYKATLTDGLLVLEDVEYGFYDVSFVLNGVTVSMTARVETSGDQILAVSNIGIDPAMFLDGAYDVNDGNFYAWDIQKTENYAYKTNIDGEFWAAAKLWLDANDYDAAMYQGQYNFVRFGINMTIGGVDAGIVISIEDNIFNLLSIKTEEKASLSVLPAYSQALTGGGLYLVFNRKANGSVVAYLSTDMKTLVEFATFNGVGAGYVTSIGACFFYADAPLSRLSYSANVLGFNVADTFIEALGNETVITSVEAEKGEVIFGESYYKVGETVSMEITCTVEKTSIVKVEINGEDYTDRCEKGATWTLTLPNSLRKSIDVVVTYVEQAAVDATVTVDYTYGDFNGMMLTFANASTGEVVALNKVIADNKVMIEEIESGTELDVYLSFVGGGTTVYVGKYTVEGAEPKALNLGGMFVEGSDVLNFQGASVDVPLGEFGIDSGDATSAYSSYAFNTNIQQDICVAVKFDSETVMSYNWMYGDEFAIRMGILMQTAEGDIGLSLDLNAGVGLGIVRQNDSAAELFVESDPAYEISDNGLGADGCWLVIKREWATGDIYAWVGPDKDALIACDVATSSAETAITALGVCFYSETDSGLIANATEFKAADTLAKIGFGYLVA